MMAQYFSLTRGYHYKVGIPIKCCGFILTQMPRRGQMLSQRRRHWVNIEPTLGQVIVLNVSAVYHVYGDVPQYLGYLSRIILFFFSAVCAFL